MFNINDNRMYALLYFALRMYHAAEYWAMRAVFCKPENSVLVMRLDAIGDAVIWLDAAKEYRRHLGNAHLVLVCSEAWREMAQALPYFDEVIGFSRRRFERSIGYRLKFLINLKRRRFRQIINPVYSRDFFVQDIIMHNLRGDEKIGYSGNYDNTINTLRGFGKGFAKRALGLRRQADRWYSRLVDGAEEEMMELTRNADFVRKLWDKNFRASLPSIPFALPAMQGLPKDYVLLFVGASTPQRMWDAANWNTLMRRLPQSAFVICGGENDMPLAETIVRNAPADLCVENLAGKTSLMELFAVIAGAKYVITNDSSASHIAPAVRTPSVCLLGGSNYGRFHPYSIENLAAADKKYLPKIAHAPMDCYGCHNRCIWSSDKSIAWRCIANITPEQALEQAKGLWE